MNKADREQLNNFDKKLEDIQCHIKRVGKTDKAKNKWNLVRFVVLTFIGFVIIYSTGVIQGYDSQINEHNNQIFMIQNEMNEKMINANHALEVLHEYISYRIYLISGIMEISYSFNLSDLEPYSSPQKIAIYLAVNNDTISKEEGFELLIELQNNDYKERIDEYLSLKKELNSMLGEEIPEKLHKNSIVKLQNSLIIIGIIFTALSLYIENRMLKNE